MDLIWVTGPEGCGLNDYQQRKMMSFHCNLAKAPDTGNLSITRNTVNAYFKGLALKDLRDFIKGHSKEFLEE